MARCVDQIEVVDLAIIRLVLRREAVCALMVIPRSFSMSIESSTCASISLIAQSTAALNQAVCQAWICRDRCAQ
jgi:hypothetical protein